jgi:hypothetical protein
LTPLYGFPRLCYILSAVSQPFFRLTLSSHPSRGALPKSEAPNANQQLRAEDNGNLVVVTSNLERRVSEHLHKLIPGLVSRTLPGVFPNVARLRSCSKVL